MRKIICLVLVALLIGCEALSDFQIVFGANESENPGYVVPYLEILGVERMDLTGVYGIHSVDVVKYEYVGDQEVSWEGYPYMYGMYDPDRDIHVFIAENDKKGAMVDRRSVTWEAGVECTYPKQVEALYSVSRIYDYYSILDWKSPSGDGYCPIFVYTDVHYLYPNDKDSDLTNNAAGAYFPEEYLARIYIGEGDETPSFEVIAHEYTHCVLHANGLYIGGDTPSGAVHEGYADVMGVCASGADWDMFTWRKLSGGGEGFLYHTSEYKPGETESHAAATIIGHAAYLMSEELPGRELTKLQIAKLFLTSMQYLGDDPGFWEAGQALIKAAEEMLNADEMFKLSEDQVQRVGEALVSVGLLDESEIDCNEIQINESIEDIDVGDEGESKNLPDAPEDTEQSNPPKIEESPINSVTNALEEYLEEELTQVYGSIPNGDQSYANTYMGTPDETEYIPDAQSMLSGMVASYIIDLDADDVPELLVMRVSALPDEGYNSVYLEIYEVLENNSVEKTAFVSYGTHTMASRFHDLRCAVFLGDPISEGADDSIVARRPTINLFASASMNANFEVIRQFTYTGDDLVTVCERALVTGESWCSEYEKEPYRAEELVLTSMGYEAEGWMRICEASPNPNGDPETMWTDYAAADAEVRSDYSDFWKERGLPRNGARFSYELSDYSKTEKHGVRDAFEEGFLTWVGEVDSILAWSDDQNIKIVRVND